MTNACCFAAAKKEWIPFLLIVSQEPFDIGTNSRDKAQKLQDPCSLCTQELRVGWISSPALAAGQAMDH